MTSKITVIGLPGAGKSKVLGALAALNGQELASTDVLFRIYRADPAHPVSQLFCDHCKEKYGIEAVDFSRLADGKEFRAYSKEHSPADNPEQMFRDYEELMIKWMAENGEFDTKVVDMSAAAYLRENVRKILHDKNIKVVLLDTSHEMIVEHLTSDYERFKETGKATRGGYEKVAMDAEASGKDVREALFEKSLDDRAKRMATYALADVKVVPGEKETPAEILKRILALV